jgi:transcriptional regulator with XRE-family HTH domain
MKDLTLYFVQVVLKKEQLIEIIGFNIRKIRLLKGLTIKELAFEADMEYTHLSRIERGKLNTSIYQIYVIAIALKVDYVSLFEHK